MNSLFKVDATHARISNIKDGWAMKPLKTRFGFKLSHQRRRKILGLRAFHARLNGTASLALHCQFLEPSFFLTNIKRAMPLKPSGGALAF